MPGEKSQRVTVGTVSLPFHQHRNGWRFAWKDDGGTWHYVTRKDKAKAMAQARIKARELHNRHSSMADLSEAQKTLVRRFLELDPTHEDVDHLIEWRENARGITIGELVDRFHAVKDRDAESLTPHRKAVAKDLRELIAYAGENTPAGTITSEQFEEWIHQKSLGWKRTKARRANAIQLYRWAHTQGLVELNTPAITEEITEEEREIHIWTPDEGLKLLENVTADYRVWLLLAGWTGLRSGEIRDRYQVDGLRWTDIKLDQKWVDLPARLAKGKKGKKRRRIVPLHADLVAALKRHPEHASDNLICPRPPTETEIPALSLIMEGWKKNALRHSYGTYRLATTRKIEETSAEMGNSPAVIRQCYDRVTTPDIAAKWWSILAKA